MKLFWKSLGWGEILFWGGGGRMWKCQGQGLNLHHIGDKAESSTCWAPRELPEIHLLLKTVLGWWAYVLCLRFVYSWDVRIGIFFMLWSFFFLRNIGPFRSWLILYWKAQWLEKNLRTSEETKTWLKEAIGPRLHVSLSGSILSI